MTEQSLDKATTPFDVDRWVVCDPLQSPTFLAPSAANGAGPLFCRNEGGARIFGSPDDADRAIARLGLAPYWVVAPLTSSTSLRHP